MRIELPAESTLAEITAAYDGREKPCTDIQEFTVGERAVVAERKYFWQGRVSRTNYLHIYVLDNWRYRNIVQHWREQKNGNFKTV